MYTLGDSHVGPVPRRLDGHYSDLVFLMLVFGTNTCTITYIIEDQFLWVWVWCCLMTPGLSEDIRCQVWTFSFSCLQVTRSNIRPNVKWVAILMIADGHLIFLGDLCGYIRGQHTHFITLESMVWVYFYSLLHCNKAYIFLSMHAAHTLCPVNGKLNEVPARLHHNKNNNDVTILLMVCRWEPHQNSVSCTSATNSSLCYTLNTSALNKACRWRVLLYLL